MIKTKDTADRLEKLGFKNASANLKTLENKKRKLAIAYEHYRFVRQEKIKAFNEKLKAKTLNKTTYAYQTLAFTSIDQYTEVPPDHVLEKLGEAQEVNCFDSFEIAHIREVKDPILFGRINDCSDRFFIDQWDDDVKIEDILMPNEG